MKNASAEAATQKIPLDNIVCVCAFVCLERRGSFLVYGHTFIKYFQHKISFKAFTHSFCL